MCICLSRPHHGVCWWMVPAEVAVFICIWTLPDWELRGWGKPLSLACQGERTTATLLDPCHGQNKDNSIVGIWGKAGNKAVKERTCPRLRKRWVWSRWVLGCWDGEGRNASAEGKNQVIRFFWVSDSQTFWLGIDHLMYKLMSSLKGKCHCYLQSCYAWHSLLLWPCGLDIGPIETFKAADCGFMPRASIDHAVKVLHLLGLSRHISISQNPGLEKKRKIIGLPSLFLEP